MSNPRLLLLDEVSLGLAPIVVRQVYEAIPVIKAQGTTVLVIEQDVNQALRGRRPVLLPARGSHRAQWHARRGLQGADHRGVLRHVDRSGDH